MHSTTVAQKKICVAHTLIQGRVRTCRARPGVRANGQQVTSYRCQERRELIRKYDTVSQKPYKVVCNKKSVTEKSGRACPLQP